MTVWLPNAHVCAQYMGTRRRNKNKTKWNSNHEIWRVSSIRQPKWFSFYFV